MWKDTSRLCHTVHRKKRNWKVSTEQDQPNGRIKYKPRIKRTKHNWKKTSSSSSNSTMREQNRWIEREVKICVCMCFEKKIQFVCIKLAVINILQFLLLLMLSPVQYAPHALWQCALSSQERFPLCFVVVLFFYIVVGDLSQIAIRFRFTLLDSPIFFVWI